MGRILARDHAPKNGTNRKNLCLETPSDFHRTGSCFPETGCMPLTEKVEAEFLQLMLWIRAQSQNILPIAVLCGKWLHLPWD